MRAKTVQDKIPPTKDRYPGSTWDLRRCLWLLLLLPTVAGAAPGLHLKPMYGPYGDRFAAEERGFGPESPLLPAVRNSPIQHRVKVDSTGVKYQRLTSGFSDGTTISLDLDDYLGVEYDQERNQLWKSRVRREFRSTAVRQLRTDKSRFQWSVPFPESRTLRRIIGEEGPTLSLNGSRKITIAGKSEWTEGEVQTAAGRPSKFPSLSMEQESKFTVEGKVGELINIRINQDTENLGSAFSSSLSDQLANQIKLDYKGDEDAIFQEVQAGNTTLELPSTRFVGFRQQNKGLFGIRTKGRLGPFGFTAIASHEKSKSNRKTFRGGAAVDTTEIRDWQYLRNTYFFLDEFYRANLPDFRRVATGTDIRQEDFIDPRALEVYINDFNTNNDAEDLAKEGVAWADLGNLREESGWVERGTWHLLDPDDDYTLVSELGYIILRQPVQDRHALAVIYRTQGGQPVGSKEGETLLLKLIKARDARPEFPTWKLEWKNVYRIGSGYSAGRKFDLNSLGVQILREIPGKEPEPSQGGSSYLQVFGLDERGNDPGSPPDRLIDRDYVGLDDLRGHLIFPDQTPFNPQHSTYRTLKDTIPDIYTSQQQRDLVEASRYIIQIRSSSTEQRISLGGVLGGVQTESVEVRLNGRQLQRGADFNVDFAGNVTFLGNVAQEVSDPGTDLEISYETEDIFGLGSQQKTLLGLRTEYEFWGGDGRIGSTMIYNNERTSERRVRVGNEPSRTIVWNLDLKARRQAPFLTRMVDALPLVKTAVPSEFNLEAEIAQSRPNLNTKGRGYIDDFEGSERPISLGIGRTRWTPSSLPNRPGYDAENQARMIWYNPYDGVQRTDIWPGQEEQLDVQNKRTDVLVLELMPEADEAESWNGVQSAFTAVNDFSQSKFIEVWVRGEEGTLQIDLGTVSEDYTGSEGKPDGKLDSEDEPFPGRSTGDGLVSKEEDVGIDGRDDNGELNFYLEQVDVDTTGLSLEQKQQFFRQNFPGRDVDDPQGDNWKYDSAHSKNDYSRVNGTQGNKVDLEAGDLPDTEDLNNDGVLSTRNDYYHYEVDLATAVPVPDTESKGWRMFRLPMYGEETERVGSPDSTRIEYARLILSSQPKLDGEPVRAEVALIEVVQNEWQEDDVVDLQERFPIGMEEGLNVTAIGTDKSLNYHPPPGVKIRRNVQSRTREREQSLVLVYDDLEPGHQMSATKILNRTTNYTKYRRMRMYVHGDTSEVAYVRGDSSDLELFVRFGADSTNYYEFISRIYPGWEGGRSGWDGNQVDVDLMEISQLKAILQNGRTDLASGPLHYVILDARGAPLERMARITPEAYRQLIGEGEDPLVALDMEVIHPQRRDGEPAIYRVRGNPSMQQIKQLSIGLRNRAESQALSGQVYLDELRLDEARNDPGVAAFARVNTKLADFINLDTQVDWRQDDFRTVTREGGNSTDLSTSLQTTVQLHQLLPGSWGFSLPAKVNLSQTVNLPRFGPNSDVELTSTEKDSLRTDTSKEFYDISISRRQGKNWLLKWTIDQMNLRLSHSRDLRLAEKVGIEAGESVRPLNKQEAQTVSFTYQMPLPRPSLGLFGWMPEFMPEGLRKMELRYLPSNLSYSMGANRRKRSSFQAAEVDRQTGKVDTTRQEEFRLNETYAAKVNPLPGISADYNLKVDRDLRKKLDVGELSFGREVGRNQKADVNFNLRFIRWLDQNYTFSANYQENSDPTSRRVQTVIDTLTGSPLKTRDITTKADLSARFNMKIPALLKLIGKAGPAGQSSRRGGAVQRRRRADDVDEGERPPGAEKPAAEEKAAEEKKPDKPFFIRRLLYFSGDYIEPFSVTWRRNANASDFNLIDRPPMSYQLGIENSLKVERASRGLTQQDAWSQTRTLEMGSGLRLPLGISVKNNYNEKFERRSGSSQTRKRVRKERRYPRLTLSWSRADRLPYIKKVINSAQVNASMERGKHSEGEGSLAPRNLITRGDSRELRVSWNGRWRFGPTTSIERVYNVGNDYDFELVTEEDSTEVAGLPPLRGSSRQERTTTTFSIRHNLKPRSMPLFGKLKSNVDLKFEFSLESELRANATGESELAPINANDRWKTTFTASYNFSQNFRGDGLIRIENNYNKLTDKTRKIRELRLSGTFFLR